VHVRETVIRFADDAYMTPVEARKIAAALVELADYAEGLR
jgi:dTDP-4-dehydrorhamnose reductase